jgi:hypothetical protein
MSHQIVQFVAFSTGDRQLGRILAFGELLHDCRPVLPTPRQILMRLQFAGSDASLQIVASARVQLVSRTLQQLR